MELSPDKIDTLASKYHEVQPLATTEDEHREMLPRMFAAGEYGWRDAEWVVQWYFRRFLGAYPDDQRRTIEATFGENDYEELRESISGALDTEETATKLDQLIDLSGVDISIGTAYLQFMEPRSYLVMSTNEWEALLSANELNVPFPAPPSVADYETYLAVCRSIARRCDVTLWTVYQALWVLGAEEVQG